MGKRTIVVLLATLELFTACSILSPQSLGTGSDATPTLGVDQPDGVALTFLTAWTNQDYASMYQLLSLDSQKVYTQDQFSSAYTNAAKTMTLTKITTTPAAVLSEITGTSAQFSFHVRYDTLVLGPVERDLKMYLVNKDGHWGIVWDPGLILPELTGGYTLQLAVQSPSRANIYDRNGLVFVASDAPTVTIEAVPGEISATNEGQMLDLLSRVLRIAPDKIKSNYSGAPADQKVALGDADAEIVQANQDQLSSYPGLYFVNKTSRRYYNSLAPHVMGYTSYIPKEQLTQYEALGYSDNAVVGLSGLEKWGEQYLAGISGGTLSTYTPAGDLSTQVAQRDPKPAQNLYTTLDRNLQAAVQDTLVEAYKAGTNTWAPTAGGAAVVVLDVNTGNALALANYPDFDPNILNPHNNNPLATSAYLQDMLNNPLKPFLDRATQGQYPPGSIFKIVTSTAAYESGVETPDSTYTSIGYWDGLGQQNRRYDWLQGGHGTITFAQALTASCDSCFYEAGLLLGQKDPMIIPTTAREYGFGQNLGLQIEENPGLIPDPNWLKQTRSQDWSLSDSVNIAIGQGDVLATPLQVAVMIGAIANGGTIYRPHFVDHVGLSGQPPSVTFQPEVIGKVNISLAHLQSIRDSMHAVASDAKIGTAQWRLGDMSIQVAGKTGTAQVSGATAPPIAWFAGYAPFDKPEIAVVVMIENGGQGSAVAAPIFRRIVERYYNLRVKDWPPDWSDPSKFDFVKNSFGDQ